MSWNSPMMSDQWLGYSMTSQFSINARYFALREGDDKREFYFPQVNWLVKRWNEVGSQANLYLSGAWGLEHKEKGEQGIALGAIEADWESRVYYTSLKYQRLDDGLDYGRFRIGMAPYVAEFHDLHTWIILQVEHQPEFFNETQITPLLRFFQRNLLWEVGASLKGRMMFNFMVHF